MDENTVAREEIGQAPAKQVCSLLLATKMLGQNEQELKRRRQACKDDVERAKITLGSILREQLERAAWCISVDPESVRQAAEHGRRRSIFVEIDAERRRQDEKWGANVERIPSVGRRLDGSLMSCGDYGLPSEEGAQIREKIWRENGNESLAASAVEELAEAVSCGDDERAMRAEVMQLAALCVKWIEGIDRRTEEKERRVDRE